MAQHRTVDKTTFTEIGKWTKEKIEASASTLNSSINNKVDKVEGSSLATSAQLTQIETNKTSIESLQNTKADTSALDNYLKTSVASQTYATKDELANLGDLKGACLKSELDSKKASCKANDMYIVTDDSNHIWYYTGTEFVDTQAVAHVDLSNYYDKSTLDGKINNKVDKVSGKELVSTADITQITTNKTDIATVKSTVQTIESDLSTLVAGLDEIIGS